MLRADTDVPIVCQVGTLTTTERDRYDHLRTAVVAAISDTRETTRGFRVRVAPGLPLPDIAEWMLLERRCCPFLDLGLVLDRGDSASIELNGGPGVKEFLRREFSFNG